MYGIPKKPSGRYVGDWCGHPYATNLGGSAAQQRKRLHTTMMISQRPGNMPPPRLSMLVLPQRRPSKGKNRHRTGKRSVFPRLDSCQNEPELLAGVLLSSLHRRVGNSSHYRGASNWRPTLVSKGDLVRYLARIDTGSLRKLTTGN